MFEKGDQVAVVQTMRNTQLAATLLATAASLITVQLFSALASRDDVTNLVFAKLFTTGVLFVFAFFAFTIVMRDMSHAGFFFALPPLLGASSSPSSSSVAPQPAPSPPPSPPAQTTTGQANDTEMHDMAPTLTEKGLHHRKHKHVPELTDEQLQRSARRVVKHAAVFFYIALRLMYVGAVSALWLIGPIWLLVGTIILIVFLFLIDVSRRTP